MTFSSRTALLLDWLSKFYTQDNIDIIKPIINQESRLSLRILDWFATRYSKKHQITYRLKQSNRVFDVHESYKSQLKAYSKKNFDPFCRSNKFRFAYGGQSEQYLLTTPGQLCFFKWCIENDILDCVTDHYDIIEKDMLAETKPQHASKNVKDRQDRQDRKDKRQQKDPKDMKNSNDMQDRQDRKDKKDKKQQKDPKEPKDLKDVKSPNNPNDKFDKTKPGRVKKVNTITVVKRSITKNYTKIVLEFN